MSETENKTSKSKQKYSMLAILVFILGLSSLSILVMHEPFHFNPKYYERLFVLKSISVITFVAGLFMLFIKRTFKGRGFAITGTSAAAVSLILGLSGLSPLSEPHPAPRMLCGSNLSGIGKAILIYANDHNDNYPEIDKWCDLLIIYSEAEPSEFVCKGSDAKLNESSYAINIGFL